MNARELLLAACLLCAVVASIALVRAAEWTQAHWGIVAILTAALLALALVLWERRRVHYWREQEVRAETGQWGRVFTLKEWPKRCLWCSMPVWSWRDADTHMDPEGSACAAFLKRLEERDSEPATAEQIKVDVLNTPGRGWPAVLPDQEADGGEQ